MAAQPSSVCVADLSEVGAEPALMPAGPTFPAVPASLPIEERLKGELLASGAVTAENLRAAEAHACREKSDLARALTGLSLASYRTLGECLSRIASLPYVPLLDRAPPYEARRLLSFECASKWLAMPAAYDRAANRLTLVVHDPARVESIRRIFRFFVPSQELDFGVASRPEIEQAFQRHFGARDGRSQRWLFRPLATRAPDSSHPLSSSRDADGGGWKLGMRSWTPPPYETMRRALMDAAALLVSRELERDPARLAEVRARVRYCQLLADRASLSPAEMDGVMLAAWIADFEAWRHLAAPYALDATPPSDDAPPGLRIESQIVSLVMIYQEMKRLRPRDAEEVAATRRHLQERWPSADARPDVLEEFLALLSAEAFLTHIGRGAGRILIVDAEDLAEPVLSPPLQAEGYAMDAVPSAQAAWAKLKTLSPDLVLCNAVLPDMDGAQFCRKLRAAPVTSRIPIVVFGKGEKGVASKILKAGADEFLAKPVDVQILALKISRLLAASAPGAQAAGFKGSLRDMGFADLIQVAGAGDKRMEIVLAREGHEARISLDGGYVVHASVGGVEGEEAFYAAMTWRDGEFSARRTEAFERETMRTPIVPLLMEGARRCDEDAPAGAGS
jgi:CheY-like chemotaxis protein